MPNIELTEITTVLERWEECAYVIGIGRGKNFILIFHSGKSVEKA